ncbi:MAG TPA: hypothetical protein VGI18_00570, partial [Burkholderiales bacterium]
VARTTTIEGAQEVVERLSRSSSLADGRVCYVHGQGGRPIGTYEQLKKQDGIEIVFARTLLPRFIGFLQYVVASHEGLVKINDRSVLPKVFSELMHLASVGIYCVGSSFESNLVRLASESALPRQQDLGVKADPGYMYYIVDADNAESPTGVLEIISHGVKTPSDLVPYV